MSRTIGLGFMLGGATVLAVQKIIKLLSDDKKVDEVDEKYSEIPKVIVSEDNFDSKRKEIIKYMDIIGKKELEVASKFKEFIEILEKIDNRPDYNEINKVVNLPVINLEKLKDYSLGAKLILNSVSTLDEGSLGKLAISGTTYTKEINFIEEEIRKYFINMKIKYTEILNFDNISFYNLLEEKVKIFEELIDIYYLKFTKYISELNDIESNDYTTLKKEEKSKLQNAIIVSKFLYEIIGTKLVLEDKENKVNEEGINDLLEKSNIIKIITDII